MTRPRVSVVKYLNTVPLVWGMLHGEQRGKYELDFTTPAGCADAVLAGQADGADLISVEDLVNDGRLHPVQQAMVDLHGSQCGFCTPGFVMSLFAWALLGFGNIYYGLAKRALDVSIAAVKSKRSLALSRSMAYHPEAQHAIAEMVIELEGIEPHLESVAEEWSNGVDHGAVWPSKVFAAKYHAVEGSWRVVDPGLDVTGGYGIFRSAGYERLVRDARLGRIHPANAALSHEFVAKTALGINPDELPRWG